MCIVAIAWKVFEEMPLLLISNRDEFYHRASQPLDLWQDRQIYAGRDLLQGGTWLGITAQGRWAVVTNFREINHQKYDTSRGQLVQDFLESNLSPMAYAKQLQERQNNYAGFNLLVGNREQAVYMSNRGEAPQALAHGVYVVSNTTMGTYWQKTQRLRQRFIQELLPLVQLKLDRKQIVETAWNILYDDRKVAITDLPDTGVGQELEQILSSIWIKSPTYGTRCSNVLTMSTQNLYWVEKQYHGEHTLHEIDILLEGTSS